MQKKLVSGGAIMNERRWIYLIVALLTLFAIVNSVSAQQLNITIEVQDVVAKYYTPVLINLTITNYGYTEGLSGFEMDIVFDNSLMSVNDVIINFPGGFTDWNFVAANKIKLTAATAGEVSVTSGYVLVTINATALRNDGSWNYINITFTDFTVNTQPATSGPVKVVNGTFTTLDEVPPTISFNKNNGSTVGPELDVVATIFDFSGINASSIEVYINSTKLTNGTHYTVSKINDTTWNVNVKTNVSKLLGVVLPHDVEIKVIASDTKGNAATAVLLVTAANIGFFNPYPLDNSYINTSSVVISVKYSQINPNTVKMFLDGVNVTSDISIDQANGIVSYNATNLSDGSHTVKVNGTGVDGNEYSKEWSFIVDTTPPQILFFQVKDGDGDRFIERNEDLTACWNVSDVNFDRVEILYDGEVVKTINSANSSVTFSLSEYGGNITLKAYDKAENSVESQGVYVYNNYVAYVIRSQPKEVMGLNITKLATLDVVDPSVVYYEFIGVSGFSLPLQNAERIIIPGTKASYTAIVDDTANKTISQFPSTAVVYDEGAMLDFYIKAPARGLIMVVKLNDSEAKDMAKDLLGKKSLKGFSLENLTDLMDYAYIFDEKGWVKAKYDKNTNQFTKIGQTRGDFTLQATINEIIDKHSVDISKGFRLSDHDTNYTTPGYSVRPVLEKGYYALIVISVDYDVTALDLVAPFVVLNGSLQDNKPSVANTVMLGDNLRIEFPMTFNAASALLLAKLEYNVRVKVDLTESLLNIANVTLTTPGKPLKEIVVFNKSTNIWVPEGVYKISFTTKDLNYLDIDTSGLEPGEYHLYVVAIDGDYQTLYAGELSVTVTEDTLAPTIDLSVISVNESAIVLHYRFEDNDLLNTVYMIATYPNGTPIELLNVSGLNAEIYEGNVTVNVTGLSEGQNVTIYAEASDRSGKYAESTVILTKPAIANANESKTIRPIPDVPVGFVAGVNNTTVSLVVVKTTDPAELNVTNVSAIYSGYVPVKYVKVEPRILNGSVSVWILRVKYSDSEISGLDESKLALFYWNGTSWVNLKELWGSNTCGAVVQVDQWHNMTCYSHDLANNYIEIRMDNLSVFALAGSPQAPPPPSPPTVGIVAGEGGYVITPTPTPTPIATPITTPTPVVTPVITPTPIKTPVPVKTPVPTPTPTLTPTPTPTPPPPAIPTWVWVVIAVVVVVVVVFLYLRRGE